MTMDNSAPAETTHSKTNIGGGTTDEVSHTYTLVANVPNLTEWPSGNYIARVNCSVIDADVTFKIAICRVDSTGTLVSTLGTGSSESTTGFKSFTHNLASPLTVNSGDRLQIRILVSRAANHGNQELALTVGTSGSESRIETPITTGYTLPADQGSFSLTGQDTGLTTQRLLTADQGSFSMTGYDTGLTAQRLIAADQGTFIMTGYDTGLVAYNILPADQGSFTMTGYAAGLTYGYGLLASQGTFTMTGQDTGLAADRMLNADQGSFAMAGQDTGFNFGYSMTAEQGSFVFTGYDANLKYIQGLTAEYGNFTMVGQDATLKYIQGLPADQGSFTMTGYDVILTYTPAGGEEEIPPLIIKTVFRPTFKI